MTVAAERLWSTALHAIRERVSPAHFQAWYAPVRMLSVEPVAASGPAAAAAATAAARSSATATTTARPTLALILAAASNYAAQLIGDELRGKLGLHAARAVAQLEQPPAAAAEQIVFRVLNRPDLFGASAVGAKNAPAPAASPSSSPAADGTATGDTDTARDAQTTTAPATPIALAAKTYRLSSSDNVFQATLSGRFDLAEFVLGPENTFAHQGAKMVVDRPGARFGILFLHGPAGTGKTHLLQGACIDLHRRNSHLRVLYLHCEQWVNAYLEHTKHHRLDLFRRAVRSLDVLAIDDLQFLVGKKGSQREFLYMLEALLMSGKQVLLASQLPAAELKACDPRLLERLYSALSCPLEKPGEALREAIAEKQFARHHCGVSREALKLIGGKPSPSLHELEGRVNLLLAKADGQSVGLQDCRRWLGGDAAADQGVLFPTARPRPVAIPKILEATAAFFHVKPEEIRGRRRSHGLLQARIVACKLARDLTGKSLQEIGKQLGDRSHATVLHCLRRFDVRRGVDPHLTQAYRHLHDELTAAPAL